MSACVHHSEASEIVARTGEDMTTIAETSLYSPPATTERGTFLDKLLLIVFVLYLASNVFDGVLRYALVNLDLPTWLLYLRDAAVIAVVPFAAAARLRHHGVVLLFVMLATALHATVAWSSMHSAVQLLFGIKVLLTVAFGALVARPIEQSAPVAAESGSRCSGASPCIGVLVNAFVDLPWTGVVYSVGDVDVEASRDWSSDGVARAAGFSRFSISAGVQIALLAIFLMTTMRRKGAGGVLAKGCLVAATLAAVFVTNSRGGLAAFAIVTLMLCCVWLSGSLTALKTAIFAAVLPVVLLPIYLPGMHVSAALAGKSLQSFLERMEQGWPGAWDLIFRSGTGLLGRGIGGIGSPQRIFNPQYYFPADNLTIFLFAYFGIFAAFYLAWPLIWAARLPRRATPLQLLAAANLLYFLLFGIVMNIIEDQFAAAFLGATLALLARNPDAIATESPSNAEFLSARLRTCPRAARPLPALLSRSGNGCEVRLRPVRAAGAGRSGAFAEREPSSSVFPSLLNGLLFAFDWSCKLGGSCNADDGSTLVPCRDRYNSLASKPPERRSCTCRRRFRQGR